MDKKFIEEIKRIRKNSGLTQAELDSLLNIHQTHLSKIESGEREPTKDIIKRIGLELGVDFKEFMDEYFPNRKTNLIGEQLRSVKEQIKNLVISLPIEIPCYLQRSEIHDDKTIIHYEYSANKGLSASDLLPTMAHLDIASHDNPMVKGVFNERYYDYPRTDPTDLLIVNRTITPIDNGPESGKFHPNHWSKYTRVLIITKKMYNGFKKHPALYIGMGKVLTKLSGKKLKVYDLMQVSRVRQGTKKEKPVWSKYDGPFQSSIEAKDTMDDLNRDVKSTTYHTKTYPQKRTQISYQVLKRNATAEEIQDIEDEENEFQAEILEAELEDKKAAAIVKPKEKIKKQK